MQCSDLHPSKLPLHAARWRRSKYSLVTPSGIVIGERTNKLGRRFKLFWDGRWKQIPSTEYLHRRRNLPPTVSYCQSAWRPCSNVLWENGNGKHWMNTLRANWLVSSKKRLEPLLASRSWTRFDECHDLTRVFRALFRPSLSQGREPWLIFLPLESLIPNQRISSLERTFSQYFMRFKDLVTRGRQRQW